VKVADDIADFLAYLPSTQALHGKASPLKALERSGATVICAMGKRKSSKPPPKKQKPKLDVSFSCPFCNSDKSVQATMDWTNEVRTYTLAFSSQRQALGLHASSWQSWCTS